VVGFIKGYLWSELRQIKAAENKKNPKSFGFFLFSAAFIYRIETAGFFAIPIFFLATTFLTAFRLGAALFTAFLATFRLGAAFFTAFLATFFLGAAFLTTFFFTAIISPLKNSF
jgi:hypothetical protein